MSLFKNTQTQGGAGQSTGGSLFANKPPGQQAQTGGTGGGGGQGSLFSNQPTSSGAGGTQQGQQQGQSSGGLFGNKPPTTGGGAGGGTSGGGGGLFGGTSGGTTAGAGTGGGGGGLFANKPTGTGTTGAGTTTTTTGGGAGGLFSQGKPGETKSLLTGAGGATTQQPLRQEPQFTSTFQKYLKACQFSNNYLFDLIVDPKPVISEEDFKKLLADKEIAGKLKSGLDYYKPKSATTDQAFKEMNEGKLRWPGGIPISPKAQEIIKNVSDKINLDIYQTLHLFELYFEFDKPLLDKITNYHPQNPANVELEPKIIGLQKKIVEQYYKERITLLDCLYQMIIIATSPDSSKYSTPIKKFVNDWAKGKPAQEFWNAYKKLSELGIPDYLGELQEIEEWVLQNLREQFHTLKLLYIVHYDLEECSPDLFYTMLTYFHGQSFYGSFLKHERQVTIKEVFLKRQEYAQMIADLNLLILLSCMKLDAFDSCIDEPTSNRNPLNLLLKKGKEISEFFAKNSDNVILSPIIVSWKRLIDLFLENIEDKNVLNSLKNIKLDTFDSDPQDYLQLMLTIKARPLFLNSDKISLSCFRNTLKSWVTLLAQHYDASNLIGYETLVDICCECLKERQNLERFWTQDIRNKNNLYVLLSTLLRMFPFRGTKFIKLITRLLGDKRNNYVTNVLRVLGNLHSYSTEIGERNLDSIRKVETSRIQGASEDDVNIEHVCTRDIDDGMIRIPQNTRAILILKPGEYSGVFQFSVTYNFWNLLFRQWTRIIHQVLNNEQVKLSTPILKLIKLVCKMVIFDNSVADILDEYLLKDGGQAKTSQSTLTITLLLLDTLYYFQRIPQFPEKIISLIYRALASLQAHPVYASTLATLIQLYPRTIQLPQSMTSSYYGSRTFIGQSTTTDTTIHPVLEIFTSLKKLDNSIENAEKRYDIYISMLKFAYEIVLNNEFIFDQYPTEKYVKFVYSSDMITINKEIQDGVQIISRIHDELPWDKDSLAMLQEHLRKRAFQSVIYSTFLDDLFTLIFKNILDNYDKMLFTPNIMDKKWKIGNYLFRITDILLQKFLVNLERRHVMYEAVHENILLTQIIYHINSARLPDFILKTLEVIINPEFKGGKISERFSPIGIENRAWAVYILNQNLTYKQSHRLRETIASCLSCLETILNLIEIYNENRMVSGQDGSLTYQSYVNKLNLIDTFDKILTKKEFLHQYTHRDSKQTIKINFILALFSYVNFETNKSLNTKRSVDHNIEKLYTSDLLKNSMILEDELLETDILLSNLNPELAKNVILKSKLKNNQFLDSVSTLALRIITKLIIIWDDQLLQRKPLIYEYITMITHFDSQFTSSTIIKAIIRELLTILVNYESQLDDACALMEMLIVSLHSQRTFVDIFLKNSQEASHYQQDSFLNFVRNFFEADVEIYKPLLIKVIIFLYEVFQRETHYKSFIESIRSDNTLMNNIFSKIFKTLKPNYSLVYRLSEYGNLNKQIRVFDIKNPAYQLEKLMIEGLVMQECSNLFAIVVAIRFMTQELIKSNEKLKVKSNVSIAIKEFFSGFFTMWLERFKQQGTRNPADERDFKMFLEDLKNPDKLFYYDEALNEEYTSRTMQTERDMSISTLSIKRRDNHRGFISISEIKRYQRRKQKQLDEAIKTEGEPVVSKHDFIVLKGLYKILDINLYGYGKDFLYDTQEIFFALKNNRYKDDFVYYAVMFLNKQNLLNSVLTLEHKYFEAMITLFKFISTLGLTGKAFSSTFYHFALIDPEIYTKQDDKIFDNENERFLANPNSKIKFSLGFADFFTKVNETDPLDKKITTSTDFLEKVVRIIWNAIKDNDKEFEISLPVIKSLEQKINFLTYAFNALFYLMQVSKSIVAKEAKQKKARPESKDEIQTEGSLAKIDKGLSEIIREIYHDLNSVVWTRVVEAYRSLDIDISPFVIFQLSFLHCVKENVADLNIDKREIRTYVEVLEIFAKANVNCLSLIISCLEVLFKIDETEFVGYLMFSQDRLIKSLIAKIMHENFLEIEYAFVMKFFINLASDREAALHLKNNNLIWELYSNKKMKLSPQINDYENGQRNPLQILWCWMLVLMRQLLETLHDEPGFINSAISFLKEYTTRINYTLALPSQIFGGTKPQDQKTLTDKTSSIKFTLAYFEELECTTALLFEYFQRAEQWALINRQQFEIILYNITHNTLKLFTSTRSIFDSTIAVTSFEKSLEQIVAFDEKSAEAKTIVREASITSSPFRIKSQRSMFGSELLKPQRDITLSSVRSYNPSVFAFKVEISMLNSLIYLLYSLKNGFQQSDLHSYFDEFDIMRATTTKIPIKYEATYWDTTCSIFNDVQSHLLHTLNKWMANTSVVDKIAKKYDYINNSVIYTMENFGLNTNFQSYSYSELRDLSQTALELAFFDIFLHFSMFKQFKAAEHNIIEETMRANRERTIKILEEATSLVYNKSGAPQSWETSDFTKYKAEKRPISNEFKETIDISDFFGFLKRYLKSKSSDL